MNGLRGATRFKNDGITVGSPGSGTVTSVGLTLDATGPYVVQPATTPITTSGTFVADLQTQNPNLVFAGPGTGGTAKPTFRSLVAADIPNLDTGKLTTGTLPIARGGTNSSTALSGNVGAVMLSNGTAITELLNTSYSAADNRIIGSGLFGINPGVTVVFGNAGTVNVTAIALRPTVITQDPDGTPTLIFDNNFQIGAMYAFFNNCTAGGLIIRADPTDLTPIKTLSAKTGTFIVRVSTSNIAANRHLDYVAW